MTDFYEILEVEKTSSEDEIKRAYRRLALKWHPDKNLTNKVQAEEKFKLISEAYEILSDSRGRFLYDQFGPTIIHSETTEEELERLFRTIVDDVEFLRLCQQEFDTRQIRAATNSDDPSSLFAPTSRYANELETDLNQFIYQIQGDRRQENFEHVFHIVEGNDRETFDQLIQTNPNSSLSPPEIVHEINLAVYYDFNLNPNQSNYTFTKRFVIPDEQKEKNRFAELKISTEADRLVKIHDFLHHSQPQQQQKEETRQARSTRRRERVSHRDPSLSYPKLYAHLNAPVASDPVQKKKLPSTKRHSMIESTRNSMIPLVSMREIQETKIQPIRPVTPIEKPRVLESFPVPPPVEEFNSTELAQIVEEQLAAVHRATLLRQQQQQQQQQQHQQQSFKPLRTPLPPAAPINSPKFVRAPQLQPPTPRPRHVEPARPNFLYEPLPLVEEITSSHGLLPPSSSLNKRDHQLPLTSNLLGSRKIPDHVKCIDLSEVVSDKKDMYFDLLGFETVSTPLLRRTKSMRHIDCPGKKRNDMTSKRSTMVFHSDTNSPLINEPLTSPLKSIKINVNNKKRSDLNNPYVFKEGREDKRRKYDQLGRAGLSNGNSGYNGFSQSRGGYGQFSEEFLNRTFHFHNPFDIFEQFMSHFGMEDDFGFGSSPFADLHHHVHRHRVTPQNSSSSRRTVNPHRQQMALFDNFFSPMRMSVFDHHHHHQHHDPFDMLGDSFGNGGGGGTISSFNFTSGGGARPIARKTTKSTRMVNGRRIVTTRTEENGQTTEVIEEDGQITSRKINGITQAIK